MMSAARETVKAGACTRGTTSVSVAETGRPVQSPATVAVWVKDPASISAWVTVCGTVQARVAPAAIVVEAQVTPVRDDTGTSPESVTVAGTLTTVPAVTGPIGEVPMATASSGVASTGFAPMKPIPSSRALPAASSSPTMTTIALASRPAKPTHRVVLFPHPLAALEHADCVTSGATWNCSTTVPAVSRSRTMAGTPCPSVRVSRSPNQAPKPHSGRLNVKVSASRVVPSPMPPDSV